MPIGLKKLFGEINKGNCQQNPDYPLQQGIFMIQLGL
jgi:hypothetical protein